MPRPVTRLLLTADFGMTFFGVKFPVFVGLIEQRKASLGSKAELIPQLLKALFL